MGMADARDITVATNYAREEMENVKNDSSLWNSSGYSNDEGKYDINVNINGPNVENLYNIVTTVSWYDRNAIQKEVELETLIYNND